jgi:GT2 family glycosyltransferase
MPPTSSAARVAIILVNWNGWQESIECLDSLLAQRFEHFEVFIVDNASTDASVEKIARWCESPRADSTWRCFASVLRYSDRTDVPPIPVRVIEPRVAGVAAPDGVRVTVVRASQNRGFAAGCNLGLSAAGLQNFDYFWLLNPDTVVAQDALVELVQRISVSPRVGMVGSTLLRYFKPQEVEAMGGAKLDTANGATRHIGQGMHIDAVPAEGSVIEREMVYVMGASMLVSRQFVTDVGLMEEDYFLYYEEVDWALRAKGRYEVAYAPASRVFHKSGANSRKSAPLFSTRFYYRNRLRFVARFMPERLGAAKRSMLGDLLRQLARGQWPYARIVLSTLLHSRAIVASAARRT